MKVMSIIGIVWFSLSFLFITAFMNVDLEAAAGWGILGMAYAIPYSIVGLVKSKNASKKETNVTQELIKLAELKEKGVLTEDEFQTKKIELLKM